MRRVAALMSCLVGVFVLVGWQKHRLDVTTSATKAVTRDSVKAVVSHTHEFTQNLKPVTASSTVT